jgi:fermentation-respiration switch protein FrsA (DUF1100 family)
VGAGLLLYVAACANVWSTQRQRIFEPTYQLQTTPDRNGMRYEEVRFPSGKGAEHGELHGWWIPAEQTNAPTLLYLHGNSHNISYSHDVENATRLHSLGYNLLLIDYRGYGKSTGGAPSEAKVYEDAEAAWNYLLKQRASAAGRTFIYGHSMGGAIGVDLAVRHPEAAGIIVESSFTTMQAMGEIKYNYLPVGLLLHQRFDTLKKIPQLKIPLVVIHGTWDETVPYRMGQQLFDAAPPPKTLKFIEGGEHNNNSGIAWLEYRDAMNVFVQKYVH